MSLTEKQERFVEEYLVDLNATAAASRAGYKDPNIGRQLITKNNVSEAIQNAIKKRSTRTEITQDQVLKELARVAFANGTDFARVVVCEEPVNVVDEEGELKQVIKRIQRVEIIDTGKLDAEKRAAIAGIKEGKYGIEVNGYDKLKALELLGKHLGMFDARTPKTSESDSNLLDRLVAGTEEDMNTDDLPEVE